MTKSTVDVRAIQAPLRERYRSDPSSAMVPLTVHNARSDLADPLHCLVAPDAVPGERWRLGAHAAVGGAGNVGGLFHMPEVAHGEEESAADTAKTL